MDTVNAVLDALPMWEDQHGRRAVKVYVSPLAAFKLQQAVVTRDAGDSAAFHSAAFGLDVVGLDWHEDPDLQYPAFRFE